MLRNLQITCLGLCVGGMMVVAAGAQELSFVREIDTIPVVINGVPVQEPFAGGYFESKPAFADLDADGDFDLVVGEGDNGKISFFRNAGTAAAPNFQLETETLVPPLGHRTSPAFADMDGDNDLDLFVGTGNGTINFYRNTGTSASAQFALESVNFDSIDVGAVCMPAFVDIDNDGDFDLIAGEYDGNLNYYRNTGSASSPTYELVTEAFASINVGFFSVPAFADLDADGDWDLLLGTGTSKISYYQNTGTSTSPVFALNTANLATVEISRGAPAAADLDGDGDMDVLLGGHEGNLALWRNDGTPSNASFSQVTPRLVTLNLGLRSNFAFADIDADGDLDLFGGERNGNVNHFKNTGTPIAPAFTLASESLAGIDVGFDSHPAFADIDIDGDFDLFVGERDGNLNFYENTGSAATPVFTLVTENLDSIDVGVRSHPALADIDADGDVDLFVGEDDGNVNFYRNAGTPAAADFVLETESFAAISVGFCSVPAFADLDHDGDLDLVVAGCNDNLLHFYRNTGTASSPAFAPESGGFASVVVDGEPAPALADIDADGDADLFVGDGDGGLYFYRNVTVTGVAAPAHDAHPVGFELRQNYPNPFNPETRISYQLANASRVRLDIYNLLGQHVATLIDMPQATGHHTVGWNGKDAQGREVTSGVYLYRIQTPEFAKVRKLTLVR